MIKNTAAKKRIISTAGIILFLTVFLFLAIAYRLQERLIENYEQEASIIIKDRNGQEIAILENKKGYYARYADEIPSHFKSLLLKNEDKYFYYHPGLNPGSIAKATFGYLGLNSRKASSTISQQLVKILLGKELKRNLKNKIIEAFYTFSLEIFKSKDEILKMYVNSVYFGSKSQGLSEASDLYFNLSPDLLTDGQIVQLLSTIHSPTGNNPAVCQNEKSASLLAQRLNLGNQDETIVSCNEVKENLKRSQHANASYFEIEPLLKNLNSDKELTIDEELTERIREIVKRNIDELRAKNVKNGAVFVIKIPENEILALIGSPNPKSFEEGYQINMLQEPRPIGSTVKPFIYAKAFEKGLRPYTLIDDREYKYITALGFPLYPKNFDYKYRGEVTLHYALSNSLNVPAVKVLEYIGLQDFYNFMEKDLGFTPVQKWENYQLGIALGALEMSLFDLSKNFTIFPNNGILKDLKIYKEGKSISEKRVIKQEYIQLVNKILNDRKTGIEQFGLKSDLNLFQENYALKTGTSRDFRDSWVIGFTPDFLVGVWVGNSDNSPMDEVTGQMGAGRIWAQVMELILNSDYNKETPFDFSLINDFYQGNNIEYGLLNDNYEKFQNALKENFLIISPHDGDSFLLESGAQIVLEATKDVDWFLNDGYLGKGTKNIYSPQKAGIYKIKAAAADGAQETVSIVIND